MSGLLVRGTLALALCAGLGFSPVIASTVVVPDGFPTVQSAIDSGADTVLIREGTYLERPVVDRAVVLGGIGTTQPPRLSGLQIYNSNFWADPPSLSVSRIDFAGPVAHTTVTVHPRNLQFSFTECVLDSGFNQVLSMDPDDVALLSFRNCRMRDSNARAYEVDMDADTVDGGVAWRVREPWIQHCWFRGGSGVAIQLTDEPHSRLTVNNHIANYATGIYVNGADPYTIEGNIITGCETGIQVSSGFEAYVMNNEIRDCGVGVDADIDNLYLRNNIILGSKGAGVSTSGTGLIAEHNVVGECGGAGFFLIGPQPAVLFGESVMRCNTLFGNGGSGIAVTRTLGYPLAVEGNIAFGNSEWGLTVPLGQPVELGCNDWFGNGLGAVDGVAADSTDVSVDPLFCNVDSADVRLDSASPMVDVPGCGQIGALGVGCGVTATLVQRFKADRVSDGIRIVWEVAGGATASAVWLERSEGENGEAWTRPLTERSIMNRAVVELDRGALADHAYWYRLVAREGPDAAVIGPPIVVGAQARPEFRLVQVGPNPGSGPVRITFALARGAAIEIDVFDVQGRRVASPGRGNLPAGTHVVEWNGLTLNGEVAPSGLYLLRYAYPGGQDRRRLVRIP